MEDRNITRNNAKKGHQGFMKHPVIEINQDGTIRHRFNSIGECARILGIKQRHSISDNIKNGWLCGGHKLMYEEDYIKWADYSWKPRKGRDIHGRFINGHKLRHVYKHKPISNAERERRVRLARELIDDPNCKFGKIKVNKPIKCVTTGKVFESVKDAGEYYNIPSKYISASVSRGGTTMGLKFEF